MNVVEREYHEMLSRALRHSKRRNSGAGNSIQCIPFEWRQQFKEWFCRILRSIEVSMGGSVISPEEIVVHAAAKRSAVPPYGPLHCRILSILALYSDQELIEVFGSSRAARIRRLLGR